MAQGQAGGNDRMIWYWDSLQRGGFFYGWKFTTQLSVSLVVSPCNNLHRDPAAEIFKVI
jgi:hypothetical protein